LVHKLGTSTQKSIRLLLAHEEQGVLTRSNQLMHGAMKLHHGSGLSGTIVSAQTSPIILIFLLVNLTHPLSKVNNIYLLIYQVYYSSCLGGGKKFSVVLESRTPISETQNYARSGFEGS
jgi:hypothetical protein